MPPSDTAWRTVPWPTTAADTLPTPATCHGRRCGRPAAPPWPPPRACGAPPRACLAEPSSGVSSGRLVSARVAAVGRLRRVQAVAEPVDHAHRCPASIVRADPGIAAHGFSRHRRPRRRQLRTLSWLAARCPPAASGPRSPCPCPGLRVDVEVVGHAANGAEPGARRARGRIAVGQAPGDVCHPGPAIERQRSRLPARRPRRERTSISPPLGGVLDEVAGAARWRRGRRDGRRSRRSRHARRRPWRAGARPAPGCDPRPAEWQVISTA